MKIFTLDKLSKIIKKEKNNGNKIVHCHGVFDLMHIGHINHFNTCKKLGNILVVTITPDRLVNKGPNRPAFKENLRAEALAALKVVDYVAINETSTAVNAIKKIKPNFYCKGRDYIKNKDDLTGKIQDEKNAIKFVGGEFKATDEPMFSSSQLINQYLEINSEVQKKFIKLLKKKVNFEKIKKKIDHFSNLRVLVVGETIIDKYTFCEALGKSGKESVLSFKDYKTEKYLGGILAIARHLSSFCKKVDIVSFIGDKGEEKEFIKKRLEKNINFFFIKKKNSKTIIKQRIIDQIDNKKLIGIYSVDDKSISETEQNLFIKKIKENSRKSDLLILADYGHGIFTQKVIKEISKIKKYKSLNAQINSTNMGFHNIRKYQNINSVIINAGELRHEMRDREGNIEKLGKKLKQDLKAKNITVTMGRAGVQMVQKNDLFNCPAFGLETVDKVGTGDSMLAILSLCLYSKLDENLSLFLASLAAAQSIKNIGNSKKVNKEELLKTLFHLMK
jgi:rfaE bifunctional protein kinase chain/domain/rfaE bifunctional protein nucleotidyltransferase chain/domain